MLLFLYLTGPAAVSGQTEIDSLKNLYNKASNDSLKLVYSMDLVILMSKSDPIAAIELGETGVGILEHATDLSDSTRAFWKMSYLHSLATAYGYVGDVEKSTSLMLEELNLAADWKDKDRERGVLLNLGVAYQNQSLPEDALQYYRRSLEISKESQDTYGIAMAYGNIGTLMGAIYPDSIIYYYRRSLEWMQKPGMRDQGGAMGWMMNNIGAWFARNGDTDSAFVYYFRSLEIRRSVDHMLGQFLVEKDIADLYWTQGDLNKALEHINESIRIGELSGFSYGLDRSYALRSELRSASGNYKGALSDHLRSIALRDSLNNESNAKDLVRQTMRYEYGRKHLADSLSYAAEVAIQEKEVQKARVMRNGFMAGFGLVAMFAGVFLFQRNRISKERKRSDNLLLNILPAEVADELKSKGAADARSIEQVTVLFTDFTGFTNLSEQMSATELVSDLNEYFSAFDRYCEQYGIEKIKTIGDAYMAAGGLSSDPGVAACQTTLAALEMQAFMRRQQTIRKERGKPWFEMRVGIHTGPVVAGIVGLKKFQYDIWGDTVNTASRVESVCEAGRVNISQTTYELIRDRVYFSFEGRGQVDTKGKGALEMWFVDKSQSA